MKQMFAILLVGCENAAPPPPPPTPRPPPLPVDAAADRACPPAHFATIGGCRDAQQCATVFEIDHGCVVRQRNELKLDVEKIIDLAWPKVDRDLYLAVGLQRPGFAWGKIAAPLTTTNPTVKWTDVEVGSRQEPFGLDTDGTDVVLATCTTWVDDNEEEWHCEHNAFRSLTSSHRFTWPVAPPYVTPFVNGPINDTTTLRMTKSGLKCQRDNGPLIAVAVTGSPLGTAQLDGGRYAIVTYDKGARGDERPHLDATPMTGCKTESTFETLVVGPAGWFATADQNKRWQIHHRTRAAPVVGADGKPWQFDADDLGWTQ